MTEFNQLYLDEQPSSAAVASNASPVPAGQPSVAPVQTPYASTPEINIKIDSLQNRMESLENTAAIKGKDADFLDVDVKERLTANFGKIGGWDMNAGVLSTPKMEINSNTSEIKSTDYTPGIKGFKVSKDLFEAQNGIFRGTMKGSTFAYDVISAVGGQLIVANSDALASDMTSLDACKMVIKGNTTFAVNDMLVMRGVASSGIQEEWFRVTAVSGNTLTVTRDLVGTYSADANPLWKAGTPVVKQGSSDGVSTYSGGWLRLIGEGTNAPYYSVFARTGVAYNAYSEVGRFGNLNGFLSYNTDIYGIAIGDTSANMTYEQTNGLKLGGTSLTNFYTIQPSDHLVIALNTTRDTTSATYVKVKEMVHNEVNGSLRLKFDLTNTGGGIPAYARIYKNGVAFGTERSTSTGLQNFSEDLGFNHGDLIQIYAHCDGSNTARVENFRAYYDKTNTITMNTINLN